MKFNLEELIELTSASGGRFYSNSLADSQLFCQNIATSHYENFPVGSLLIPKNYRQHFYSVYAFSRVADDIADELQSAGAELQLKFLEDYKQLFNYCHKYENTIGNPIFIALRHTMLERSIPQEPFQRLLIAFQRDINFTRPVTMNENIDYCHYSANPIGELVLRIFGLWNESMALYSNSICTGLQLTNFWQDISRDLEKGRVYIPQEVLPNFPLVIKDYLANVRNRTNFTKLLQEQIVETETFFRNGADLIPLLPYFRLRLEIAISIEGGRAILRKINRLGSNILIQRPSITIIDIFQILLRTILHHKIFNFRS